MDGKISIGLLLIIISGTTHTGSLGTNNLNKIDSPNYTRVFGCYLKE